jgi:hypothetical protein
MKKVYQTIIDKGKGNCMQAALAALFDLELNEVVNFNEIDDWQGELFKFVKEQGYDFEGTLYNSNYYRSCKSRFHELKEMGGVNGYFFATVLSPKYYNATDENPITHAVIVDQDLNIVHDPNPNYKKLDNYPLESNIKHNGIINVYMINKKE